MNHEDQAGKRPSSYRDAGVDIDAGDLAKRRIAAMVSATHGPEVLRGLGHFGSFVQAPGTDNPYVLVSSADGVGTKILLATLAGRHESIGVDLVNHCVNDILAGGARPLFFMDYFAADSLETAPLEELIRGMTAACQAAGCALTGGETAQLPGIYPPGTYDLAGFIVGTVHRDRIVDGSAIQAGDLLIGLPSSGLHTNGYTLARAALDLVAGSPGVEERLATVPDWADRSLVDLLLEPHRSYLADVGPLLDTGVLRGMAHITGGGLAGNIERIIPSGLEAVIDVGAWTVPPLFQFIAESGRIPSAEMYRVFNMGIGYVIIVAPDDAPQVLGTVAGAQVIGTVERGRTGSGARYAGLADDDRS